MKAKSGLTPQQEKQVAIIIKESDKSRIGHDGGYWSDYVIERGKIYWADISQDGAPWLGVFTFDELTKNFK